MGGSERSVEKAGVGSTFVERKSEDQQKTVFCELEDFGVTVPSWQVL